MHVGDSPEDKELVAYLRKHPLILYASTLAVTGVQKMNLVVQIATVVSIVIGIVAFFYGVKVYAKQMNAQVFLEYTRRYEDIMKSFPKAAWGARLDSEVALPDPSDELSTCVLRYLNLCSEEYYLFRGKYLSKAVWGIWEREIARTLRVPLLRREWLRLCKEFDAYPEFQSYVNSKQA